MVKNVMNVLPLGLRLFSNLNEWGVIRYCLLDFDHIDSLILKSYVMADSFYKKEREKKRRKKKQEKAEKKKQRKSEGKTTEEFMYMGEDGNLTSTPPEKKDTKEIELEEIQIKTPKKSELDTTWRDGKVKFYNEERQFGFINEIGSKKDYFVHADNVEGTIRENDRVTFELGTGSRGIVAINVKLYSEKKG